MKLFKPAHMSGKTSVKGAKLSSHLVKPAHFASSKVSIKAPKIGAKRSVGKIKL